MGVKQRAGVRSDDGSQAEGEEHMTKEEAWLMWMQESNRYVEYDWDTIKKSSHWQAFSRGWDAASVNVNGWDDAYKMGIELGKEMENNT
jgi:hypothetical protein